MTWRDTRNGVPLIYAARLAGDGTRLAPDSGLAGSENIVEHALAWDGAALRLAWSAEAPSADTCCEVRTARIDCGALRGPPLVTGVLFTDKDTLTWDVAPGASTYDVIGGDLALLDASGGDFAASADTCEANDLETTSLVVSERALPAWYVVRADDGSYGEDRAPGSVCP